MRTKTGTKRTIGGTMQNNGYKGCRTMGTKAETMGTMNGTMGTKCGTIEQ